MKKRYDFIAEVRGREERLPMTSYEHDLLSTLIGLPTFQWVAA